MAKIPKNDFVKIDPLEKIARLLAIHISKGVEAEEAAIKLLVVGFDSPTIGVLLGKNPNFANAAKSRAKDKS